MTIKIYYHPEDDVSGCCEHLYIVGEYNSKPQVLGVNGYQAWNEDEDNPDLSFDDDQYPKYKYIEIDNQALIDIIGELVDEH